MEIDLFLDLVLLYPLSLSGHDRGFQASQLSAWGYDRGFCYGL